MKDTNKENDLSQSFYTSINAQSNYSTDKVNQVSFENIEPMLKSEEGYHYLCPKCHIFPFIEFTKSKKYIKFTCLCYTDEKIGIKDLFDKNYITTNSLSDENILSSTNVNYDDNDDEDDDEDEDDDDEDDEDEDDEGDDADDCEGLKCKEHDSKFKYF